MARRRRRRSGRRGFGLQHRRPVCMSAFNARLRPKAIFGLPLFALASATLRLPLVTLALLVPVTGLKIVFGVTGLACLVAALFFLILGDELVFLRIRWCAWREDGCVTTETGSLE